MALSAGSVEIRLFAELARLQSDMKKANRVVEDAMGGIQKTVRATSAVFNQLAGAFGSVQIIKLADDYKRFDAQLKLSTKSLNEYNEAYSNVIRIGRTAQSDIGAIGVLYARLNNNLRDFNVTQSQVAGVTETISLALRTNNATVQETNSVMLQLSQSFGSGKLNGQEFLAVAEGAPMLLRQLANSLKVPFGALKDLSAQGKITREDLLKAWSDPAYLEALRQQVKEVGTVTSSITVLMNNIKQYIGEADKATSTTKLLAGAIKLVADNINLLVTGALTFGVVKLAQWVSGTAASIVASKAKQVELVREAILHERKAAAEAAAALVTQTAMANNARATTAWAVKNGTAFTEAAMVNAELAKKMKDSASASGLLARALNFVGGPLGAFTLGAGALVLVFPKLVDWAKAASERAYTMSDGYNGVSKSLAGVKKSIEDLPVFALEKLFPDYKQYRKGLDEALGLAKEVNQIIPTGAKLTDSISFGNIGEMSEKFKEIKGNFDAFAKASPLKDLTAQTEEYRTKLELLNKAREYGLAPVDLLNRYEAQLTEEYKKATGATKANGKAIKDANEALKEQIEFLRAADEARRGVIIGAVDHNKTIEDEIKSTRDNTLELQLSIEAYEEIKFAKIKDAIVTSELILANAKLNGATKEAIAYAEAYIQTLDEQLDLELQLAEAKRLNRGEKERQKAIEVTEKMRKDSIDEAEKQEMESIKDIERERERASDTFSKSLSDAIFRGFEEGKTFAQNFRDVLKNSFKTLVLQPLVKFLVDSSGIGAVLGTLGTVFSGNASATDLVSKAGGGGDLLSIGSKLLDGLKNGFGSMSNSLYEGIASVGTTLRGFGLDQLGTWIENNSTMLGNISPYIQAGVSLLKGDFKSAIFEGAGAAIGSYFGGPIGGAIGSFLGGAVGGLFGGSKAKRPVYVSQASSVLDSGNFSTTFGTLAGQPKQVKSLGANANLESVNKAFSESLGALMGGFGINEKISTSIRLWKRKAALGWFNASFGEGSDIALYSDLGRGDVNAAFQSFFNRVLGEGLVSAIQKTRIPEGIKRLFAGLTDTTQVNNMINAAIGLNKANQALVNSFNITAEQTANVAMVSGLAGDELIKVIAAMVDAANASRTIGDALFELRNNLKEALGGSIYSSLVEFDNALKGIDKSTQAGVEAFYELFALRDEFAKFQSQIDSLKLGVRGSLLNIVSDAEKQAMMQEDLASMFAKLNLEVPSSIQELIALGKSIDYTTAEGLNLASVFPTLVTAFNDTQGAVERLMNTLRDSSKFATSFEFNRYTGLATNYGTSFANNFVDSLPSYDVGTPYVPNDGMAMLHKGEAVIPAKYNGTMNTEPSGFNNADIRAELRSIAISAAKSERSLDRLQKDGFIIRDVDANGDPQIISVTVV